MRILALEPYYGGSHRAFIDGWRSRSRFDFDLLTLPASKWKWRMRHAAMTFAQIIAEKIKQGCSYDLLFATDMLNLAELTGLVPESVRCLPRVLYFHENQLTYPDPHTAERDLHFAFTNITSCLAADEVWFNSGFHREIFLSAVGVLIDRMPDFQPSHAVPSITHRSTVQSPGVSIRVARESRRDGPLHILWVARWEHDKNPELFFEAVRKLRDAGAEFRLSILGESFRERPDIFNTARGELGDLIDHWGYQQDRQEYENILARADVVVSTARHEFFGIAVIEAVRAGCYPLLPDRLSYPELLSEVPAGIREKFFYNGSSEALASRLLQLSREVGKSNRLSLSAQGPADYVARYDWDLRASALDDALQALLR